MSRPRPIIFSYLQGLVPYMQALELQEGMVNSRLQAKAMLASPTTNPKLVRDLKLLAETDIVLFMEHAPVYTAGRRESIASEEISRLSKGADHVYTKRGGQTTFHGPGQLMCYPILDLGAMKMTTRDYVCKLQKVLKRTLAEFDVSTVESEHVGAFVTPTTKIGSIGVHVRRRITSHGFVLNVDNQCIPWFQKIVACGLSNVTATSIQHQHDMAVLSKDVNDGQLRIPLGVADVVPVAAKEFGQVFGREMIEQSAMDDADLDAASAPA